MAYTPGAPRHRKSRALPGRPRELFPAPETIDSKRLFVFEGEPDAITATLAGLPAVAVPGAHGWQDAWTARFEGREVVVCMDCDPQGREATGQICRALSAHGIRAVSIDLAPDRHDGFDFRDLVGINGWDKAIERVRQLGDEVLLSLPEGAATVQHPVPELALRDDLLGEVEQVLHRCGLVGERKTALLAYLAVTSRLLAKPVSIAVKGPSSGGKSFTIERTLALFPGDAYYAMTGMSERALAYSTEPLSHRMLVIYEMVGMTGDWASYLVRSLLSEGRIRYETVEKTKHGMQARLIEREGPTGLIVTTTATALHPENETRLLSLSVTDTREQTAAVFRALADDSEGDVPNLSEWHALQRWLATVGPHEVVVPYAARLAESRPAAHGNSRKQSAAAS